ncbi:MAG TPA: hypothetical protein VLY83_03060 [Methanoregula sp.]|nr:hypothetical protein [Methanoregula sp.]
MGELKTDAGVRDRRFIGTGIFVLIGVASGLAGPAELRPAGSRMNKG